MTRATRYRLRSTREAPVRIAVLAALASLIACKGGKDSDGEALLASGEVTVVDGGKASAAAVRAFGYATHGQGLLYLASNENATCDGIVELFDSTDPYDPSDLMSATHCNLSLDFTYDQEAGFDGHVVAAGDVLAGVWSITCAIGSGDWALEDHDGDEDYYFTGRTWQGSPTSGTSALAGSGEDLSFDLDFTEWDGDYIYETLDEYPASGEVSGQGTVEWCPSLVETPFFSL